MKRQVSMLLVAMGLSLGVHHGSHAQNAVPAHAPSSAPATPTTSDLITSQHAPDQANEYATLLDPSNPPEERQKAFQAAEARAQSGSRADMYVIGSLYRIGRQLPASPVARDLDKARLYLSNAATHGEILAMAKMAELEASAHHSMEAMTWAQIYAHYAQLQPAQYRPSEGYLAELVQRSSPGIAQSQLQDVVDHLNAFITAYDAQVVEGSHTAHVVPSKDMSPQYIPQRSLNFRGADTMPSAGFVDCYVGFGPDGKVSKIFVLDATPDYTLAERMRSILSDYKIAPSTDGRAVRYAFVPSMFDDGKFRLAPKTNKKHSP